MPQAFSPSCGFLELDKSIFYPGQELGTSVVVPVPHYLMTHFTGNVIFDTGCRCEVIDDPVGRPGQEVAQVVISRTKLGEDIVTQLSKFERTSDGVPCVIKSRAHFECAGRNEFFPKLTILVQKNEMDVSKDPELMAQSLLGLQDYDPSLGYKP